ncbi:MAG: hypothetical protein WBX01_12800 [Nitrososphaeraceae archaeon]
MRKLGNEKLSKAITTKLTAQDYDLCLRMARDYYIRRKIKSPSVSELTREVLLGVLSRYRSYVGASSDSMHPVLHRQNTLWKKR